MITNKFITNSPVRSCCGKEGGECTCKPAGALDQADLLRPFGDAPAATETHDAELKIKQHHDIPVFLGNLREEPGKPSLTYPML